MPPYDPQVSLAAVIRAARIEAGVSQEAAAHAAGMAVGTWSKLERGKTDPRLSTLTAVAAALGVQPSELVRRAEQKR